MKEYTFLFKDNSEDRDCCAYIRIEDLKNQHVCCDGKFNIHGACYSKSLKDVNFEDVKTILSEPEFNTLCNYNGEDLTEIINKLLSEENNTLFEEVQEEEAEFLRDEYALYEEELEAIFDKYYLDYRDRAVVGCVYKDAYDLGENEAISLGLVDWKIKDITSRYFDFEKFGEDLTEEESYCELPDGRIAYLCY